MEKEKIIVYIVDYNTKLNYVLWGFEISNDKLSFRVVGKFKRGKRVTPGKILFMLRNGRYIFSGVGSEQFKILKRSIVTFLIDKDKIMNIISI